MMVEQDRLMTLGLFVFQLQTVPFETLSRQGEYRWASKDRAGGPPAQQYVGPGADTLTVDGALVPELTGGPAQLDKLREMAAEGKAWILVSGDGKNQGRWIITNITDKRSRFTVNGLARKIEFTMSLKRYWDEDPEAMGDLRRSLA